MDGLGGSVVSQAGNRYPRGCTTEPVVSEAPQLITRLEDNLRSIRELRARLGSVNRSLRGSQPETGNKAEPKDLEVTLRKLIVDLAYEIEMCHGEANEISALLS